MCMHPGLHAVRAFSVTLTARSLGALWSAAKQAAEAKWRKAPVTGSQEASDTQARQGDGSYVCWLV